MEERGCRMGTRLQRRVSRCSRVAGSVVGRAEVGSKHRDPVAFDRPTDRPISTKWPRGKAEESGDGDEEAERKPACSDTHLESMMRSRGRREPESEDRNPTSGKGWRREVRCRKKKAEERKRERCQEFIPVGGRRAGLQISQQQPKFDSLPDASANRTPRQPVVMLVVPSWPADGSRGGNTPW
jgi:hypothetical protein